MSQPSYEEIARRLIKLCGWFFKDYEEEPFFISKDGLKILAEREVMRGGCERKIAEAMDERGFFFIKNGISA